MMTTKQSRRLMTMFPVAVLAISLAACAGADPNAGESTQPKPAPEATGLIEGIPTEKITTTENKELSAQLPDDFDGVLDTAIDLTGPPARLIDENGNPAGYSVDFTNLLAQKLGVEAKVHNTPLPQIVPGLAAKRYDIAVNNLSRNPEREEQLDMIEYMQGSGGIAYAAGNPDDIDENPESLCGLRLAVQSGSFQELTTVPEISKSCVENGEEEVVPTAFGTNNEAILAVGSGRVDAWLGNGTIAAYAAAQQPEVFESTTLINTWSHDNLALPKESSLTPIILEAMQELMDEGTYTQVLEKWGIEKWGLEKTSTEQTPVVQQ